MNFEIILYIYLHDCSAMKKIVQVKKKKQNKTQATCQLVLITHTEPQV